MFNPQLIFKIQNAWKSFIDNHPKFPLFLQAVGSSNVCEGSLIEIKITNPDGNVINSNVKLTASDMELIKNIKEMASK